MSSDTEETHAERFAREIVQSGRANIDGELFNPVHPRHSAYLISTANGRTTADIAHAQSELNHDKERFASQIFDTASRAAATSRKFWVAEVHKDVQEQTLDVKLGRLMEMKHDNKQLQTGENNLLVKQVKSAERVGLLTTPEQVEDARVSLESSA
jgi:hypothetical protein